MGKVRECHHVPSVPNTSFCVPNEPSVPKTPQTDETCNREPECGENGGAPLVANTAGLIIAGTDHSVLIAIYT